MQSILLIVFYLGFGTYGESKSVIYSFDDNGNVLGSSIFEKCLLTDIQINDIHYLHHKYIICGAYGSEAKINSDYGSSGSSSPIEINLPSNIYVPGPPAVPGGGGSPGGGPGPVTRMIYGNPAAFVAEYGSNGGLNWHYFLDDQEQGYVPVELGISHTGDIFLLGNGTMRNQLHDWYYSSNISPFLVKLHSFGEESWIIGDLQLFEDPSGRDIASGISLDDQGDLYICGISGGSTNQYFGHYAQYSANVIIDVYGSRLFVAKLDGDDAQIKWGYKAQGSSESTAVFDIAVDNNGVNVVGDFYGNLSFSENTDHRFFGQSDAFLLRLNDDGVFNSAFAFGGHGEERAQCFHLNNNNLIIGGFFESSFDINPFGNGYYNIQSTGQKDAFLASYDFTSPEFILHTIYHPADIDNDNYIKIDEITSYGRAVINDEEWSLPPKDLETMLRGVFLWKNGEKYKKSGNNLPNDWVLDEESDTDDDYGDDHDDY